MAKQSYEMIEGQIGAGRSVVEAGEGGGLLPGAEPLRRGWIAPVLGGVVGVALLLGCVSAATSSPGGDASSGTSAAATPMQASTDSAPSCSLMSCTGSGCDWDSAPFLCLDGGSAGGCADKAATWAGAGESCTSFCDLSGCAATLEKAGSGAEGAEDLPRHCPDCDDKQCSTLAEHWSQACGKAAPFVCLSGAGMTGLVGFEGLRMMERGVKIARASCAHFCQTQFPSISCPVDACTLESRDSCWLIVKSKRDPARGAFALRLQRF
ncbi:unnamed protein product [Scytosiphon promiscuus]